MQKIKQQLNRVFDDRLETRQWENKVDWAIIGLIIISTVEVFLSTFDSISLRYGGWLRAIDIFTTAVFTIEVSLRIWCADLLDAKYKGFWGRVRYCLSFYGFIDIVSTYSFYLALLFPVPYAALKVLRVFRLLRVFRYMKSFRLLGDAFRSKSHELWISLQFLCIVTLILSFLLFFVEHQAQPEVYDNGWRSVVWAFMQYIGDPGDFADTPPVTFWGRLIAVLVGVLGIAIFAVPAGLIGSGFIETIEATRQEEELEQRRNLLYRRFESQHLRKKLLLMSNDEHPRSAPARYLSVNYLRAICMLTDNEILEAVRSSDDMRLRPMKSDESLRANDMTVVERFLCNTTFGYRRWNADESTVLLFPYNATEYSLSHIAATVAENTPLQPHLPRTTLLRRGQRNGPDLQPLLCRHESAYRPFRANLWKVQRKRGYRQRHLRRLHRCPAANPPGPARALYHERGQRQGGLRGAMGHAHRHRRLPLRGLACG